MLKMDYVGQLLSLALAAQIQNLILQGYDAIVTKPCGIALSQTLTMPGILRLEIIFLQ